MSIEIRDNAKNPIAEVINNAFSSAKEVKIAVAFLKWSGIEVIEKNLNSFLDNNGKLKIIVGLDFFTTEPAAIQYFLDLNKDNPKVEIRYYPIPNSRNEATAFHPKLYLFEGGENYVTVIGSSNLTKGGLCENVEINTVFTEKEAEHYITAKGIFDKMWNNKLYCKDATTLINDYNQIATKVQQQNASSANNESEKQAYNFFDTHFPQEDLEQGNNDVSTKKAKGAKTSNLTTKTKKNAKEDEEKLIVIVMEYIALHFDPTQNEFHRTELFKAVDEYINTNPQKYFFEGDTYFSSSAIITRHTESYPEPEYKRFYTKYFKKSSKNTRNILLTEAGISKRDEFFK